MVYEEFIPDVKKYLTRKTPKSKEIFSLIKEYKDLDDGEKKDSLGEEILMMNSKLVASIANKYASAHRTSRNDFFQSGMIGLMRALELFDCEKKCSFCTYATPWIKHAMNCERLHETPVMVSRGMRQSISKHKKKGLGGIGFSAKDESSRNAQTALMASIGSSYVFIDSPTFFEITDAVNHEKKIFSSLIKEDIYKQMFKILEPKEIIVIKELYFKEVPSTLSEIAGLINKSEESVRKINYKALFKLRSHFCIIEGE